MCCLKHFSCLSSVAEVTTCSYNVKSYVHNILHIIINSSGVMVRTLD